MTSQRIGTEFPGPDGEQFRIIEFVGSGSFGQVFRAEGLRSGRTVAIKVFSPDVFDEPTAHLAILNEIQLAREINHPNVIRVIGTSEQQPDAPEPFIMMEFAHGGTLKGLIRKARKSGQFLPIPEARGMMKQIALGAQAINARLVHRDIKPDNILVDDGLLKISDFGISKLAAQQTRARTFKGIQAVAYMAPESWNNEENTPQMDVYSVGLVFYELLTHKHPLEEFVSDSANRDEWRKAHLYSTCRSASEYRADVDQGLVRLLSRMVAKRPAERPNWSEVIAELSSTGAGVEVETPTSRIQGIVRLAEAQRRAGEQSRLEAAAQAEKERQLLDRYAQDFGDLVRQFWRIAEDFNRQSQDGLILKEQDGDSLFSFRIPNGRSITCRLFQPAKAAIQIRADTLVGGGYLELIDGPGANLLFCKKPTETVGTWKACYIGISALVNPQRIIGTRGISSRTIVPFGFSNERDFYEEIIWAGGGMHVFTYETKDPLEVFTDLLETAFQ